MIPTLPDADLSAANLPVLPTRTKNPGAHPGTLPFMERIARWPWWALVAAIIGAIIAWQFATSTDYVDIFKFVGNGLGVTIRVTLIAYGLALVLGLIAALGRVSKNFIIYQIASFYVEILRGVPILVLLLYVAFVIFPAGVGVLNSIGIWLTARGLSGGMVDQLTTLRLRDVDNGVRVVFALSVAYSAFLAEIFRAGIESIDRGQIEAARALGMTSVQTAIHIVLPQALRRVLPPLMNDFIAMLKDSSLVSALGVLDITGLARLNASGSFEVFRPYNVVAFMYLTMTLILSLVAKLVEHLTGQDERH